MRLLNGLGNINIWKIIRNIVLLVIAIILFWVGLHYGLKAYEQKKYPPLGQLVEVDGENMHVYTKGDGENTIVLLGGLGTSAPVLDFEPLIDELSQQNKVVVVEGFGYGWSDITKKERSVENIVEELRLALKEANISGPYILMPHSISGIYSMYYANEYPEEVKAIVGIDPTLPQSFDYFGEPTPSTSVFMKLVAPTGISRMLSSIFAADLMPIADEGTYTDEEFKMIKAITSWKLSNKNIVDESNAIQSSVNKTKDMSFPTNIPVLIFAAKNDEEPVDGKTNMTFYEEQLSINDSNKLVELEGHHYLHWTHSKEMTDTINHFIN